MKNEKEDIKIYSEKALIENIWKEIKRIANSVDFFESVVKEEKEREKKLEEAVPVAKKVDFWDEVSMWMDSVFQEAIMQIIRESAPKMRESREEIYRVVHEIAAVIKAKREIMQYLSEDGILKFDEELSQMEKEEEHKMEKHDDKLATKEQVDYIMEHYAITGPYRDIIKSYMRSIGKDNLNQLTAKEASEIIEKIKRLKEVGGEENGDS